MPRSAAVQVSPGWGAVVSVAVAAADEAVRPMAVTATVTAMAVTAMVDLPMRPAGLMERMIAYFPLVVYMSVRA
ncbi:hypothetical protein GCM10010431_66140 [Streptomyces kunmingensis]